MERRKRVDDVEDEHGYGSDQSFDPDEEQHQEVPSLPSSNLSQQPGSPTNGTNTAVVKKRRSRNNKKHSKPQAQQPPNDEDEDDIKYVETEEEPQQGKPSSNRRKKKPQVPQQTENGVVNTAPVTNENKKKKKPKKTFKKVQSGDAGDIGTETTVTDGTIETDKTISATENATTTDKPKKRNKKKFNKEPTEDINSDPTIRKNKPKQEKPVGPKRYSQQNYGNKAPRNGPVYYDNYNASSSNNRTSQPLPVIDKELAEKRIAEFKLRPSAKEFVPPTFTPVILEHPKQETQT